MNARSFVALGLGLVLGGALLAAPHLLSAQTTTLVPDQGWDQATTSQFDHAAQGGVIIPVAFMRALRTPDGKHFAERQRFASYGFLPSSKANDPWPVGLAADAGTARVEHGIPMIGITCAACHTGQLTVRGATLRIAGGSGNVTLLKFLGDVSTTLLATAKDPARRKAFLAEAVSYGYPAAKASAGLDYEVDQRVFLGKAFAHMKGTDTPSGPGLVDAVNGIANNTMAVGLREAGNVRLGLAPTNFPPLWDIWHFDYVQYNLFARQPMARNIGEVAGLGGRLNIVDAATGKLNPEPERWESSINVRTLYWIETTLESLKPPVWPAAFGALDETKVAAGRRLFSQNCARCHAVTTIAGTSEWHNTAVPIDKIGTDPTGAIGFAKLEFDGSKLGLSKHLGGAEALVLLTGKLRRQAYSEAGIPKSEWGMYDGYNRKSIVLAPCAYKARPLVGIWSTPPFLHNGSVPSVFDLLSQVRPTHPIIGNPEFDPIKLGQVQVAIPGRTYMMDTSLQGNGNYGHWFTDDTARKGRIGRALHDSEKYDLIEYLKSATYATYPSRTVAQANVPALPCQNDRNWAANRPY